jgi:hypothetical protein
MKWLVYSKLKSVSRGNYPALENFVMKKEAKKDLREIYKRQKYESRDLQCPVREESIIFNLHNGRIRQMGP